MSIKQNFIITYSDLVDYVVNYVYDTYVSTVAYSLPKYTLKDSGKKTWRAGIKHCNYNRSAKYEISATIIYNFSNKKNITKDQLRDILEEYISKYATNSTDETIISKEKEVISFQYLINFFSVVSKFIKRYFLNCHVVNTNKSFAPFNFNIPASDTSSAKLVENNLDNEYSTYYIEKDFDREFLNGSSSDDPFGPSSSDDPFDIPPDPKIDQPVSFKDLLDSIFSINSNWVFKTKFSQYIASSSSCSSSSSSSSSCSSSSSSSFITYLNIQ